MKATDAATASEAVHPTHPPAGPGRERRALAAGELGRGAGPRRRRVPAAREEHGPDAFGMFSCARATNEMNYVAQKFTRVVMGTQQRRLLQPHLPRPERRGPVAPPSAPAAAPPPTRRSRRPTSS